MRVWLQLTVLVLDLELRATDRDFFVGGVFNDDRLSNTLADGTFKQDGFYFGIVLYSYHESVEEIFSGIFGFEGSLKLVHASFKGQEVEFILLFIFACNIENFSSSDEQTW